MDTVSYLLGKKAGGGTQPTGTINITENGITNVSGYATADVNVQPTLQNKSVPITTNGSTSVSADENYDGLGTVSITTNVQPNLESKSITITENKTTTITPTTGKDGLSSVEVITNVSGTSVPDWSQIGYSSVPSSVQNAYDMAKDIYDNWDASITSMNAMYQNDKKITIFPNVDTSNVTNFNQAFRSSEIRTLPALDLSSGTNLNNFVGGSKLETIPLFTMPEQNTTAEGMFENCANIETIPQLDTSHMYHMRDAFSGCSNLKNVPVLDVSNFSGNYCISGMFANCPSLTDTSLDNILQMCINIPSTYGGTKTLRWTIGIRDTTVYPDSRIEALPHYQDFIDAGWTIS